MGATEAGGFTLSLRKLSLLPPGVETPLGGAADLFHAFNRLFNGVVPPAAALVLVGPLLVYRVWTVVVVAVEDVVAAKGFEAVLGNCCDVVLDGLVLPARTAAGYRSNTLAGFCVDDGAGDAGEGGCTVLLVTLAELTFDRVPAVPAPGYRSRTVDRFTEESPEVLFGLGVTTVWFAVEEAGTSNLDVVPGDNG